MWMIGERWDKDEEKQAIYLLIYKYSPKRPYSHGGLFPLTSCFYVTSRVFYFQALINVSKMRIYVSEFIYNQTIER